MEKPESLPTTEERRPDMSIIEHMPEETLEEVRAKKQAFNDHILKLDDLIPSIHSESGGNADLIDEAAERAQDGQDFMLIARDMNHAREEMVRLGDKEEVLILEKAA